MSMQKISEAILDKVKAEAQDILKDAEEKAAERVQRADEQHAARLEEEKKKIQGEAESRAARVMAQASIQAREELLSVKNEIIQRIVKKVRDSLWEVPDSDKAALNLIKESIEVSGAAQVNVYVAQRDLDSVKKRIAKDKELAGKVGEIKEYKCAGGAVVEDIEGTLSIDNTFETRLETLMPRILPEINKELFE